MLCIDVCFAFYSLSVSLSAVNMGFDIKFIFCFGLFAQGQGAKKKSTVLTVTYSITLVNK